MLKLLADDDLINGKTIGIDATTLEANAAMRSIVRRDTGESYQEFLTELAQGQRDRNAHAGRPGTIDKKRKNKASNDDWENPHDPDAKITKMKDGRTHLAHKARACGGHGKRRDPGGDAPAGRSRRHHDDHRDDHRSHRHPARAERRPSDRRKDQRQVDERDRDRQRIPQQPTLLDMMEMRIRSYCASRIEAHETGKTSPRKQGGGVCQSDEDAGRSRQDD